MVTHFKSEIGNSKKFSERTKFTEPESDIKWSENSNLQKARSKMDSANNYHWGVTDQFMNIIYKRELSAILTKLAEERVNIVQLRKLRLNKGGKGVSSGR